MASRKLSDWLKGYADYTEESDSPEVFHMWCALGTLAGAAQRKIVMHSARFDVFPNMYIILVSPPGRGKKGSAMRAGKSLLREVEPKVNFVTESGSFEGLVKSMSKITNPVHQSMTLYSMELGSLLATNPATMIDFLTDIYDGNPDWARQTVSHDLQIIKKPWLNIMAGTTPRWLGENIGSIALEGGLIARCILPYSEALLLDNPWPEETDSLKKLKADLVNDLSIIATLEGEFVFAGGKQGEAYKWYDVWYRDKKRFPTIIDPRTAAYFDRKHIHMLKIAMSLSLSYKDELVLELEDLQRALALLDSSEPGMRLALNSVGKNEHANELWHVLSQIRSKRGMKYGDLLVENFHQMGKKALDEVLEELRVMGKIDLKGGLYIPIGIAEA